MSGIPLPGRQLRGAERLAQCLPELRLDSPYAEVATVAAAVDVVAGKAPGQLAAPLASRRKAGRGHGEQAPGCAQERDRGALAPPRSLARLERRQDGDRGEQPAGQVGELCRGHERPAVGAREGCEQARSRRVVDVVPSPLRQGSLVSEARHGAEHQTRVPLHQRIRAQLEPLQDTGTKTLDQHVATVRQPPHRLGPVCLSEVDDDRPLAAIQRGEGGAEAVPGGRHEARRVSDRRLLDLDDVRAQRCEQRGAERSWDVAGQVEHPGPIERAAHRSSTIAKPIPP